MGRYKGEGLLFHFTKAKNLMDILSNMTLLLSSFKDTNDLNEIELCCNNPDSILKIKHQDYISQHCKFLSFTQNYKIDKEIINYGYNHPRMWAQYGDDNKGACIVINEKRFLEKNKDVLINSFHVIENISYKEYLYNKQIDSSEDENSKEFLIKHYQHIFFNKHLDWEREHERRFFGIDLPEYLSIDECVESVCLG